MEVEREREKLLEILWRLREEGEREREESQATCDSLEEAGPFTAVSIMRLSILFKHFTYIVYAIKYGLQK